MSGVYAKTGVVGKAFVKGVSIGVYDPEVEAKKRSVYSRVSSGLETRSVVGIMQYVLGFEHRSSKECRVVGVTAVAVGVHKS